MCPAGSSRFGETRLRFPSTNKLIAGIFESIAKITGLTFPAALETAIFVMIAAAVVFFSYKACLRVKHNAINNRAMIEVFVVCLVYGLIHPRFKDYGYILLLVPSYYIIKNIRYTKIAPFLFILFIMSNRMMLPIVSAIYDIIWAYYPLMVAYCVWGIYLYEIFTFANESEKPGAPHRNRISLKRS